MEVTEKDLYKFVFSPNELSSSKFEYISSNIEQFKAEIELLSEIKENLNETFSDDILDRIHNKIAEKETENQIILEPIKKENDSKYLILAADSPKSEQLVNTQTFQDLKNKFLAKVISTNDSNKIYIFQKNRPISSNINITLHPSLDTHSMKVNDLPCIITPKQNIEKIFIDLI